MKRLIRKHTGPVSGDPLTTATKREADLRIFGPFPAKVRGVDACGEAFEIPTVLDDLSAGDFNLQLAQAVDLGDKLSVMAQIHDATVALRGIVSRSEPHHAS